MGISSFLFLRPALGRLGDELAAAAAPWTSDGLIPPPAGRRAHLRPDRRAMPDPTLVARLGGAARFAGFAILPVPDS
jgi:hypothetical protein